jgi:small subunit ribosomal protein S15
MLLPKIINLISVKNIAGPLLISTRNYPGMKHEVYDYINWVRPAKIPATDPLKSGDLQGMKKIDGKELLLNFEKSKLLETANELVRSKFSVELNPRKESVRLYVDEMIKKVQRHDSDYGSMESKRKLHNFFNNKHPVNILIMF